jgi:hypothetical protein
MPITNGGRREPAAWVVARLTAALLATNATTSPATIAKIQISSTTQLTVAAPVGLTFRIRPPQTSAFGGLTIQTELTTTPAGRLSSEVPKDGISRTLY